jgi:hypothetical protein
MVPGLGCFFTPSNRVELLSCLSIEVVGRRFVTVPSVKRMFSGPQRTTPRPCGLGVVWEATNVSLSHAAAVNSSKDFATTGGNRRC